MAARQNEDKMKKKVVGIFPYLDDLIRGINALRKANVTIEDVFSPTPRHEIQEILDSRPSAVRYFTFFGGILGVLFGLGLAIYAHLQWKFITGGKPVIPWIPFVVIAFECCILVAVLSTILGLMVKTRMPRFKLSDGYDPRFTEDRFGLVAVCKDAQQEEVRRMLEDSGAEEVKCLK